MALIGLGVIASTAPTADASTTIGSTAPSGQSQDCFAANLFIQATSTGPSYVVPSGGGVITSWSVHGFGAPAQLTLKTVRAIPDFNYLIMGSSQLQTVAPSGTSTFPARIPVEAGDELALWVPGEAPVKAPCNYHTGNAGDVGVHGQGNQYPEPALGDQFGPATSQASSRRLNVSAELEPDADRDGYGDETQDACPADTTAIQVPCPDRIAPETTITMAPESKVKTGRNRVKVRFRFRSPEASTFSCTLDGETTPCSSPFRVRVQKGRHHFRVAATDGAGNVDGTPATATFSVRRK